jgi:WD40 repeat protein
MPMAAGVKRLASSSGIDTEPRFSPDGQFIYFTSDRGGSPQIYRIATTGGTVERITFDGSYNVTARPSPDGKSLAYIARNNGRFQLALMDLATKQTQILTDSSKDESPSFAPQWPHDSVCDRNWRARCISGCIQRWPRQAKTLCASRRCARTCLGSAGQIIAIIFRPYFQGHHHAHSQPSHRHSALCHISCFLTDCVRLTATRTRAKTPRAWNLASPSVIETTPDFPCHNDTRRSNRPSQHEGLERPEQPAFQTQHLFRL